MDSPPSVLSSPSKILNPLSPERINQQTIPTSPSTTSEFLRTQRKGNRGLSDVQAKVAYLNNLSQRSSPGAVGSQSSTGAAALQRAILGREEAESALVRVSSQLSEAQSRERRISERLESLLEELQSAKERQAHERAVFEKEIRKARKEAFRAGSTLVKIQEELKHVRTEAKILKDEVIAEREAKEQAKQEAFERAYALAGLTEELEVLKGRLRSAEAKSHPATLEARARKMNKEPVERLSLTEGDLALIMTPATRRPKRPAEDSYGSFTPQTNADAPAAAQDTPPKRQRLSDIGPEQEKEKTPSISAQEEIIEALAESLKNERRLRVDAQDMIEFLQIECRFKRCICRIRENEEIEARSKESAKVEDFELHENMQHHGQDASILSQTNPSQKECNEISQIEVGGEEVEEPLITFSPVTGTFRTIPSPTRSPQKQAMDSVSDGPQPPAIEFESELEAEHTISSPTPKYESHLQARASGPLFQNEAYNRDVTPGSHNSPVTAEAPRDRYIQTQYHAENTPDIINMKRIPLRAEDQYSSNFPQVPGTPISREEALAQIRARRGKTNTLKRSVSDNEAILRASGMGVTPVRSTRRIPSVQNTDPRGGGVIRNRRDLSAPVWMPR